MLETGLITFNTSNISIGTGYAKSNKIETVLMELTYYKKDYGAENDRLHLHHAS